MKRKMQKAGEWHDRDEMELIGFPSVSFGLPALDR